MPKRVKGLITRRTHSIGQDYRKRSFNVYRWVAYCQITTNAPPPPSPSEVAPFFRLLPFESCSLKVRLSFLQGSSHPSLHYCHSRFFFSYSTTAFPSFLRRGCFYQPLLASSPTLQCSVSVLRSFAENCYRISLMVSNFFKLLYLVPRKS